MSRGARYIIRLDDACPTMRWEHWERLEEIFDRHGVRPMVGVIPDCRDPGMRYSPPRADFWDRVRGWQRKGWIIGQHGHDHVYVSPEPGYLPINLKSEFAGLPVDAQRGKLRAGVAIFRAQGIEPDVFIAPSHSFDRETLMALAAETRVRFVSDGIAYLPFLKDGFVWIPQQSWGLHRRLFGLWTSCFHPNTMTEAQFGRIDSFLGAHRRSFDVSLDDLHARYARRSPSWLDRRFHERFFRRRAPLPWNRGAPATPGDPAA